MTNRDLIFLDRSNTVDKKEGGQRLRNVVKKAEVDKPLISVVTVVYNGEKFIESAIQSVLNQSYNNIEYIVVDGDSTDSTVEIIKEYDNKIDYWVSEKDTGIYDAMNKGVSLCTGNFIGILNADDYYDLDTCLKIKEAIIRFPKVDIFHGNIEHITTAGVTKYLSKPKHESKLKTGMVLRHPSCFISKKLYKKNGGYDTNLKIASDFKFLYYAFKNNAKFKYLNFCTTYMREGGVSDLQAKKGWVEVEKICAELGDSKISIKFYSFVRRVKYFINKKIFRR